MTQNQKKAYVIGGVVVSLVSAGIIGGALALATHATYLSCLVGIAVCIFVATLYFSEGH